MQASIDQTGLAALSSMGISPGEMVGTMSQLFTMVVTYGAQDRASSSVMQAGQAMATHDAVAKVEDVSRSLRIRDVLVL